MTARRDRMPAQVVGTDVLTLVAEPDDPWSRRRSPLDAATVARRSLTSREEGSGTRRVVEEALVQAGHPPAAPEVELTTTAAVLTSVRAGSPPAFLDLRRVFTAVWVGGPRPPAGSVRDLLGIASRMPIDEVDAG